MECKQIDCNSYKLHLIKTDKFKTITFKLIFRDELKKEDITFRNLLIDNLVFSTKKYPTRRKMTIAKEELYAVDVFGTNKRLGSHITTEMYMTMLNPKYTEEGMLEKSLKFLKEIIFNPNIKDGKFDKEIFEVIKQNNYIDIQSTLENPNYVAVQSLKDAMGKDSCLSYRMCGTTEDLRKVTESNLYEYYQKFLVSNYIDFYIIGDIDLYEMEKLIKKEFKFKTIPKERRPISIKLKHRKFMPKTIIENSYFVQSKLAIGGYFNDISWYESKYPCALFNIILGNSPESKFFKDIREKHSCAYTINSTYRRLDDYLLITAGINANNYKLVMKRIKNCINDMKNGDFDEKEITVAKQLYTSVINEIEDFPSSILEYYFSLDYLNNDTLEEQAKKMNSVTKEEIINSAKKFKLDTIYLLKEKR